LRVAALFSVGKNRLRNQLRHLVLEKTRDRLDAYMKTSMLPQIKKATPSPTMRTLSISNLPDEMLCAIMRHVPPRWIGVVALVSSRWFQCATTVDQETRRAQPAMPTKSLMWLCHFHIGSRFMDEAAQDGHTSAVVWLHNQLHIKWTKGTLREAALAGRKHTVATILAHRHRPNVDESCLIAGLIGGRGLAMAGLFHRAGQSWTPMARATAVALGDPTVVAALNEQCGPRTGDNFDVVLAMACRRRDLLKAMRATGAEIVHAKRVLEYGAEWDRMSLVHQSVIDYAVSDKLRGKDLVLRILAHVTVERHSAYATFTTLDLECPEWPAWGHNDLHANAYVQHGIHLSHYIERTQYENRRIQYEEWLAEIYLDRYSVQIDTSEMVERVHRKGRDAERRANRRQPMPPAPRNCRNRASTARRHR
jgi:hypothetical protein